MMTTIAVEDSTMYYSEASVFDVIVKIAVSNTRGLLWKQAVCRECI